MNVEALVWTWIYMGMIVSVISVFIILWAIFYENKE